MRANAASLNWETVGTVIGGGAEAAFSSLERLVASPGIAGFFARGGSC